MAYLKLIYLLGPPGAGKGTQARLLAEHAGYLALSTGNALREIAREGPRDLSRQVREYIDHGQLAPTELVVQVVTRAVQRHVERGQRLLLDGSPRTREEAERLDAFFDSQGYDSRALIYLAISREEMIRRNVKRQYCLGIRDGFPIGSDDDARECRERGGQVGIRPDDQPERLATRWQQFQERTYPVLERYRRQQRLREIDGSREMEAVHADVLAAAREEPSQDG